MFGPQIANKKNPTKLRVSSTIQNAAVILYIYINKFDAYFVVCILLSKLLDQRKTLNNLNEQCEATRKTITQQRKKSKIKTRRIFIGPQS